MSCLQDRKNVRKFLEDLLEETEYQKMRRHLEACASCTQFVRAAGSVSSMLMDMGRAMAPEDLGDTAIYRYEKKCRENKPASESPPVPAQIIPVAPSQAVQASVAMPAWSKFLMALMVLLIGGLAWRDWVQTRLLESVLQKSTAFVSAPAPPPSARGDFGWGGVRVTWPSGSDEALADIVRRFSPDIRYEAPGLLAAHIPAERDAEWRSTLEAFPGTVFQEVAASPNEDRLYYIEYGESP